MASTGECDGTAVRPARAGPLKLGTVRPWVWPRQLVEVIEKGWRYPPRPDELGGGAHSFPLPRRAGGFWNLPARGVSRWRGAQVLLWPPLCGDRRPLRSRPPATWAGPAASEVPREA